MVDRLKRNKFLLVVALIYVALLIARPEMARTAFDNSVYYLVEMVEIMPVIFFLTIGIEVLVPKDWIIKRFGEGSGILGNILSLVLGSVSAGPIYAAFPISKTLLSKGASIGNVVIILSAWAVVKVPMLANEAKFLGVNFMIIRWCLTVVMIFIMGVIMNRTIDKKSIPLEEEESGEAFTVHEEYCIGCGMCARFAPENFIMEDGKAATIKDSPIEANLEAIIEARDKCPAKAIKFEYKANKIEEKK